MLVRPAFIHKKLSTGSVSVPGAEDGTSVSEYIAGASVSGHRIVRAQADGEVQHADKDDGFDSADHIIGISANAASIGDAVNVVTHGPFEEASWAWDPTKLLFLGNDGIIVQDQPVAGFATQVGFVLNPTKIFVEIQRPIILT